MDNSIVEKVKKCCSQIFFTINGINSVGSGWFYADPNKGSDDYTKGIFVTAAHCAILVNKGIYYKMTRGFIENPLTKQWYPINPDKVYVDGVGDIAIIRTDINFDNDRDYCLQLALDASQPKSGDICYIVGNPGGIDEDSICFGTVRDPNYCEPSGFQITNSIYISCPGIGGNSGGPILNTDGNVIGIYTFGASGLECFGGGSNLNVLRKSLGVLTSSTFQNYKSKRYLGLAWNIPSPFTARNYYPSTVPQFNREGVYINSVSSSSPFFGTLIAGDLLISAIIMGNTIKFGNCTDQRTPGVLIYYDDPSKLNITINYIKRGQISLGVQTKTIPFNKFYSNISNLLDSPLRSGLSVSTRIKNKTLIIK